MAKAMVSNGQPEGQRDAEQPVGESRPGNTASSARNRIARVLAFGDEAAVVARS
jgi:hypothetical protein